MGPQERLSDFRRELCAAGGFITAVVQLAKPETPAVLVAHSVAYAYQSAESWGAVEAVVAAHREVVEGLVPLAYEEVQVAGDVD